MATPGTISWTAVGADMLRGRRRRDLLYGGGGVGDELTGEAGQRSPLAPTTAAKILTSPDTVYFGDVIDGGAGINIDLGWAGRITLSAGPATSDRRRGGRRYMILAGWQRLGLWPAAATTSLRGRRDSTASMGNKATIRFSARPARTSWTADRDRYAQGGSGDDELLGGGGVGDTGRRRGR